MSEWEWTLTIETGRKKYDPSQPRVPAGQSGGGRWTSGSGAGGGAGLQYQPDSDRVRHVEQIVDRSIEQYANHMGISPQEAERELMAQLTADAQNSSISIFRSSGSTVAILEEERFKTQFETGTSGGNFNPQARQQAESNGLGYPGTNITGEADRPIYGILAVNEKTRARTQRYGDVEWVLKDDVKNRSTVTVGDSLYRMETGQVIGTPVAKPGKGSLDDLADAYSRGVPSRSVPYLEVQIQGGIKLKDVQRLILHSPPGWGLGGMDDTQANIIKEWAEFRGIDVEDKRDR